MPDCLRLKKSNCKNCYKCIRHCPVKSIRFSGNQANIVGNECILCGQCFVVCPQNAKEIRNDIEKAKVLLENHDKVIVSLAPSFIANYNGIGIKNIEKGLKQLGFFACEETAVGATYVKNEYERILENNEQDILITSCCHSVNLLIQKHYPNELKYLANVLSPMQAHAVDIKKRYPDVAVVFVGPCVAKKDEADYYKMVDCVLTFEELTQWFKEKNIVLEQGKDENEFSKTRLFPTAGGVLKTMRQGINGYTYISIDGVENCIAALKDIENGNLSHCIIEMNSCVGGCIGGPVMEKYHRAPVTSYVEVCNYAGPNDFEIKDMSPNELKKKIEFIGQNAPIPSESEIDEILEKMGKKDPSQQLNCGSCGYETCREKAIAIYQGKADVTMCLPFLKDRAESFYDSIMNNTPDGILVLNDSLEVQQINNSARKIMNIRSVNDVLGDGVIRILDPAPFMMVKTTKRSIKGERTFLAEYQKYVEWTIVYENQYNIIICIMRDVTKEVIAKEKKDALSQHTIEITDKVVEKQMRIVQEIASLLGETAAETKIALTKLKESVRDE